MIGLLSVLVFTPMVGALILMAIPRTQRIALRAVMAGTTLGTFLLSLVLWLQFDNFSSELQFVERYSWITSAGIHYILGIDGLSLPLVLLTTFLCLITAFVQVPEDGRLKEYGVLFLALETAMLGVFLAHDLFLFYVFWELTIIPLYFLIGIWGGANRAYAALKFFLYTLAGSLVLLLGFLGIYFSITPHTMDLAEIIAKHSQIASWGGWIFWAVFIGLAVKIPVFPLHTWLPLAHVEASTPISMILAGILLKMGAYGIMRILFPILPAEALQWSFTLAVLGAINVVYGALCAMGQSDLKKMIAYSSISHMGYVLLGIASLSSVGYHGAVLQMVSHGLISAFLFFLVGALYHRAHTRDIDAFGGLSAKMPVFGAFLILGTMASVGLPFLSGFVSELLCFLGGFHVFPRTTAVAVFGLLLTAIYSLSMLRRVLWGPEKIQWADMKDLSFGEKSTALPLLVLIVFLGLYPAFILNAADVSVSVRIEQLLSALK
jgi:NADH-quinone oxidoreductase subunit M